jgi:hypothetical protein
LNEGRTQVRERVEIDLIAAGEHALGQDPFGRLVARFVRPGAGGDVDTRAAEAGAADAVIIGQCDERVLDFAGVILVKQAAQHALEVARHRGDVLSGLEPQPRLGAAHREHAQRSRQHHAAEHQARDETEHHRLHEAHPGHAIPSPRGRNGRTFH